MFGERLVDHLESDESNLQREADQQAHQIEEEMKTQPLVGDREELTSLALEYNATDSAAFLHKAQDLARTYAGIRRVRGDGNCFYRALVFAQLELCSHDAEERARFTAIAKGWRSRLLKLGFPDFTTSDFCDWFDELLDEINSGKKRFEDVAAAMNDDSVSNYYVAFSRLITSGYLKENALQYEGFVDGDRTMDAFCRDEIEPMWRDADHLCIIALVMAIGVRIRIEYMDRTEAPNGGWHHDFGDEQRAPTLFFLYRPGHYDILYPR